MFYNLEKIDSMHPLFQALENCRGTVQREDYHPERCLFSHSLQTLHHALRESRDIDCIIAAMVHDVGKQIDTIGHEDYSIKMLAGHLSEKTEWLIKEHIRIKFFLDGQMKKRSKIQELVNNIWFKDLIMLHRWDVMGRKVDWNFAYSRTLVMEKIKHNCG